MKNLKRTLALVLVIVMAVGMFAISANAAFTDDSDIQYKEAVEVLVKLGAIEGYPDGSFNPKGEVTREESIKMVTFAILGSEAAQRLATLSSPFKDVAADRWSARYVAYGKTQQILNGYDEDTFAPTDKVTGAQLAKMLLVCLGWGKAGEYVGSLWDVNATTDANTYNIFAGTKATDLAAPATREECALYIFNALTKTGIVDYVKSDGIYNPHTTLVRNPANGQLEPVQQKIMDKVGLAKPTQTDDFGRPGYMWAYRGTPFTKLYSSKPILETSTYLSDTEFIKVTKGKVAAAVTYYMNGEATIFNSTSTPTLEAALTALTAAPGPNIAGSNQGLKFEVYTNSSGLIDRIVVVNTYLARVTAVTADNAYTAYDDSKLTLSVYMQTGNPAAMTAISGFTADEDTFGYADVFANVKKGDYVLVTPYGDSTTPSNVTGISLPKVVGAKLTGYADGFAPTVSLSDGNKYSYSANAYINTGATVTTIEGAINKADFSSTFNFFIDDYGYILGSSLDVAGTSTPLDYVYVISSQGVASNSGFGVGGANAYAQAEVVFLGNGAKSYVNLPMNAIGDKYITGNGTFSLPAAAGALTNIPTGFYSYTTNADGKYVLTALSGMRGTAVTTGLSFSGATAIGTTVPVADSLLGKYTTSSTVLKEIGPSGMSPKTLTGYANFNSKTYTLNNTATNYQAALVLYSGATITNIYVVNNAGGTSATRPTYGLYQSSRNDAGVMKYTFIVGGEYKEYVLTNASAIVPTNSFYSIEVDTDNYATVTAETGLGARPDYTYYPVDYYGGSFIVVNSTTLYFNEGIEIYDLSGQYTAAGIVKNATVGFGDTVQYIVNSADPTRIDVIYIMTRY